MKDGRSRIKKRNWQNRGRHHRSGAEGRKATVGGGMVGGGGVGEEIQGLAGEAEQPRRGRPPC